jgi:hypothetical protein
VRLVNPDARPVETKVRRRVMRRRVSDGSTGR